EPGARLVLTWGGGAMPCSTALRATRPAAIITEGLDVFVHDVIAAITTEPCVRQTARPSREKSACVRRWPRSSGGATSLEIGCGFPPSPIQRSIAFFVTLAVLFSSICASDRRK